MSVQTCGVPEDCICGRCNEKPPAVDEQPFEQKLTASEALFGFCAWLTTRKEITKMGGSEDCAPIPPLIGQFCEENKLDDPRDGWENNLIHPSGECSGPSK